MENQRIKSFVFVDLEATGLPDIEITRTRITEIACISTTREHMIETHRDIKATSIPRVLNKLTFCVYPKKMIHPFSSDITDLTNENLELQAPFDDNLYTIIDNFVQRLPKPVCLIAYNGMKFDFPLLQSEVQKLGKNLPDDVMCADAYLCFRELLSPVDNPVSTTADETKLNGYTHELQPPRDSNKLGPVQADKCQSGNDPKERVSLTSNLWEDFTISKDLCNVIDGLSKHCCDAKSPGNHSVQNNEVLSSPRVFSNLEPLMMQTINERTPSKQKLKPSVSNFSPTEERSDSARNKKAKIETPASNKLISRSSPKSFKLKDVYEHILCKKPSNLHRAEDDTILLLECSVALCPEFINWTDRNAKSFSSVRKMWG